MKFLWIFILTLLMGCTCERGQVSPSMSQAEKLGEKVFYTPRYNVFRSLDPVKQFDEMSSEILQNVYDRLIEYHYLKRPYELMPGLLEKMPEKQDDGVTYVFELRKGVYFNDDASFPHGKGRELVADDVIYSIKRFADANTNALSYSLMSGYIVGMDDFRQKSREEGKSFSYDKNDISGIVKLGKYNFKIVFTRDNPVALFPFSMTPLSIVAREAVEYYGVEFEQKPVGTGPFYVEKLDRRGEIILKKNHRYFGVYPSEGEDIDVKNGLLKDAGRPLPLVDKVVMPLIEEAQPAILSFQKGNIDEVRIDRDSFAKFFQLADDGNVSLKEEYVDKWNMYLAEGLNLDFLCFNMKDPIVGGYGEKAKALRKAIAYALDVPGFLELIYRGRGRKMNSIVPHPIFGSEDFVHNKFYDYDVEKAKFYLEKAGYPGGYGLPELVVEYRAADPLTRQQWEYHRAKLHEVGIATRANFQTFSSFLKRVDTGNFQIAAGGWMADYPDAENFFALLYGPNESPGPNHGFYKNPAYDKLFERMRFMPNGEERLKIIKEMNDLLNEDLPMIYMFNVKRIGMKHKWLRNMKRNVLIHPPMKYVDIDLKQKAAGI